MEILEVLRSQDNKGVMVEFTKIDGTVRKMLCTLAKSLIPEDDYPKSDKAKVETDVVPTVCRVYDLEKQGWRSFRFDSVVNFTVWG
jgi:hypothetical protein